MDEVCEAGKRFPIAYAPPGLEWGPSRSETRGPLVLCSREQCRAPDTVGTLCFQGEPVTFTIAARLISAHFFDEHDKPRNFTKLYLDPLRPVDLDALHGTLLATADNFKQGEPFISSLAEHQ